MVTIKRGLTAKLSTAILSSCLLIFLVIFLYNYQVSRTMIVGEIEKNAKNLALVTVNKIETVLRSVEKVPGNLAFFLENSSQSKDELNLHLRSIVENNPEIYGATIAFEPHAFDTKKMYFAPYFYRHEGIIKFTYLGDDSYRYFYWDWYQIPKELGKPVWSEPYFDEGGGGILMSTYSVPFYKTVDGKRIFQGVVTADISLKWLQKIVSSIKIAESGYAFLLSRNGTFVTHPIKQLIMNSTIFSLAEAREDSFIRQIGREMIQGKSGFVPFESVYTLKKCWMVYEPLESTGWSLGVLFPQKELMADVTRLSRIVFVLGVIGFFVLLIVIIGISRSITRPLRVLAQVTKDIGKGHLDFTLPEKRTKDEIGALSESFQYMRDSLKQYIQDLTETTKAKERMESELRVAHDIQMSILPKDFPAFPERTEFDLYAVLEPAREVGGDLYDFFLIDDRYLFFVVGDVSGKGVPAALLMTETKMLIKALAHELKSPEKILTRVNREIAGSNDACMFVTVFCAMLDTETGELDYTNAGHNPPVLISGGDQVSFLPEARNTVLGVMDNIEYERETLQMREGDTIFVYTDGVTEAFSEKEELFSDERLQKDLEKLAKYSLQEMISTMMEDVHMFSAGIDQSDDITMLAVRYLGRTICSKKGL